MKQGVNYYSGCRRTIIGCFVFFFLMLPAIITAQDIIFNHLGVENGLSQNSVLSITQDARGFMWYGTRYGLNRYDGHQFKVYKNDPNDSTSLSNNYINVLYSDSRGTLWVGTSNGLNKYIPEKDIFIRLTDTQNSVLGVTSIYEDKSGRCWIGTTKGLYTISKNEHTLKSTEFKNSVLSLCGDIESNLWIGTSGNGLTKQIVKDGKFEYTTLRHDNSNPTSLSSDYVTAIIEDKHRNLWVGTSEAGLNLYDKATGNFTHLGQTEGAIPRIINNCIRRIVIDSAGKFWIATQEGLSIFDPVTKTAVSYQHDPENKKSLSQNSIYSVYIDKHGIISIGTYFGGINIVYPFNTTFTVYQNMLPGQELNNDVISSIVEDAKRNLWIGTEGGGLNYFDRQTGRFTSYQNTVNDPQSLSSNLVKVVYQDKTGYLWVGTHTGYLDLKKPRSDKFIHYPQKMSAIGGNSSSEIVAILKDSYGRLWTGSSAGLGLLKKDSAGEYVGKAPPEYKLQNTGIRFLFEDNQKNLWIGTNKGLHVMWDSNKKAQAFFKNSKNNPGLQSDTINCIQQDSKGTLWIGTYFGGLSKYNAATQNFTTYTQKDGLPDNNVIGILEDNKGSLWISTGNGLSHFDPDKKIFKNYSYIDGLAGNEFNYNSFFKDRKGEMFFGGYNGLTAFYPQNIETNTYAAPVIFTSLKLFNQPVVINGKDNLLKKDISLTDEIVFKHDENFFTIEFALLSFQKPEKNKYAYKLEGFEQHWNYVNTPSATYTNLPPGDYTLLVRGANNDGVWSLSPAKLRIKILPPVWQTWWAYLLYVLLFLATLFFVTRFFFLRAFLKKENELHQVKLNFFTNVSHEIRTHLTLIMVPIDRLLNIYDSDNYLYKQLFNAKRNADRLLRLVSELMDFRKAETNHLKLHFARYDLIDILQDVFDSFQSVALSKNITASFLHDTETLPIYCDKEQLEKVFFNLLSNAFKFTPTGGIISMSVEQKGDQVSVDITDNGCGIASGSIDKLFNNFFQADDHGAQNTGYGIGLALSKNIVELHKGKLIVASDPATDNRPSITTFTVVLLRGNKHLGTIDYAENIAEKKEEINTQIIEVRTANAEIPVGIDEYNNKGKDFTILITEDNAEMRELVRETFENTYNILEAENGLQGLEIATVRIPDLIISDVMMPEMNGFEFCKKLKTDSRTSHIPIILLTAKDTPVDHLQGLETGADLYLTKPFSTKILALSVRNLFISREKIRERFAHRLTTLSPVTKTETTEGGKAPETVIEEKDNYVNSIDKEFLDNIMQVVDEHMDNPEFSVAMLSRKVAMSVPVLYRKLKATTGMSVNDFIKSLRMKKAAQLLQTKQYTVGTTALAVGYFDRKYFSKEFKKQYGVTPTEFMESL